MQRVPTGEWCTPTAELANDRLVRLLHKVKTTPDEAELEIVDDEDVEDVEELGPSPQCEGSGSLSGPVVQQLSPEDEAALEAAQSAPLTHSTGETGAQPVLLDAETDRVMTELELERARATVAPVYPVYRDPRAAWKSLFALVVVVGAAAGGVIAAMNIVGQW